MIERSIGVVLAWLAVSCSPPAPTRAPAAPESPRAVASAVPPSASAASSSSRPGDADAAPHKSRKQELLAAADRLMDGELTRAEESCAAEPAERREACVDAHLAEHGKKLEDEAMHSLRALELLFQYGEAQCKSTPQAKKKDCTAGAMEALVVELGNGCPPADSDAGHRCIAEKVLKRLGP